MERKKLRGKAGCRQRGRQNTYIYNLLLASHTIEVRKLVKTGKCLGVAESIRD